MEFKKLNDIWSQEEDIQLNKLYNEDMLNILEISKINNRLPGGIINRLLNHNYITNRQCARGYTEYRNSDLYKQAVANNLKNKEDKKREQDEKKEQNKKRKEDEKNRQDEKRKLHNKKIEDSIKEIKIEVNEIKNTVNQIYQMLNAIYEFEEM